jgi:hypothetical protein
VLAGAKGNVRFGTCPTPSLAAAYNGKSMISFDKGGRVGLL